MVQDDRVNTSTLAALLNREVRGLAVHVEAWPAKIRIDIRILAGSIVRHRPDRRNVDLITEKEELRAWHVLRLNPDCHRDRGRKIIVGVVRILLEVRQAGTLVCGGIELGLGV